MVGGGTVFPIPSSQTPVTRLPSHSEPVPAGPPSLYHRYLHLLWLVRVHPTGRAFRAFTHSSAYFTLCTLLTVFSLYAEDFNLCWLPPSADLPISVLLTICLSLFSLDILLSSLFRPGYFLSFFFTLDIVGTLSLILDISFMLPLDLNSLHDGSSSQHLNQSGNVLRVTRFVRLFRVMQVIRVVKLFKFHAEMEEKVVGGTGAGGGRGRGRGEWVGEEEEEGEGRAVCRTGITRPTRWACSCRS